MKLTVSILMAIAAPALAGTCESLASLKLPATTITLAAQVDDGAWPVRIAAPGAHPPFCRVAATLRPTEDSDIRIEVWMPADGWNGNFEAVGNGGWSGSIAYAAMAAALKAGYATASTDTGHEGGSAQFALGHREKLIDYAYRSEHEMTVKAKAIVAAFYGKAQTHAYWSGCSAGGKQGLKEAQMYPADFDGIVAGSPGAYWIGRATQAIWVAQAVHKTPESDIPREKYRMIHDAALKACDRAGWRGRWRNRGSAEVSFRPGDDRLPDGRRTRLPDRGTSGGGPQDLLVVHKSAHGEAAVSRVVSRQ